MDINPLTFSYLFYLLAPFILVCYFVLSSLLQSDPRGIFLLLGSFINILVVYLFDSLLSYNETISNLFKPATKEGSIDGICNPYTILGSEIETTLPMSSSIIYYVYGYLLGCMTYASTHNENNENKHTNAVNKYAFSDNIPTHVFFILLIVIDIIWKYHNNCAGIATLGLVLLLSISLGIGVAYFFGIASIYNIYFTGKSNAESCKLRKNQKMTCTVKRNGKVISRQSS